MLNAPEQIIVYRGEKRYTYRQLKERIARLASGLASLGIEPGRVDDRCRYQEDVVEQMVLEQRLLQLLRETAKAAPVVWRRPAAVRDDDTQSREVLEQVD